MEDALLKKAYIGLLAVAALAAVLAGCGTAPATGVAKGKLVSARFFAEHLLPQVHGLVAPVKAGKDELFALTADEF